MKIFKKIAVITTAAVMTAGTMCVSTPAADVCKLYVSSDPAKAAVGDIITVSVISDAPGDGIAALQYHLEYDTEYLEYQAGTLKNDLGGNADASDHSDDGWFGFGCMSDIKGKDVQNLHLDFKVLKPNAELKLTHITAIDADYNDLDLSVSGATIQCSHKNTEKKTTPATCKDEGKEETVCKDCEEIVETKTLPKTEDHDWGAWETKENVKCGETADQTRTCKVCGKTETKTGEKVEHLWNDGEVTTEPTCTKDGVKTYTCTREDCGETKTEIIEALGHDMNEGVVIKEPTCTEDGQKKSVCERCKEEVISNIPALGHDWGDWTVTKEATTDEEGEEARECSICGEKETKAIAKLPAESTTTSYSGGGFIVPETTAASTTPTESEAATTAATTTTAPVVTQAPETTTTVVTVAVPEDNTTTTTNGNVNTAPNTENNNVGNINSGNSDDKNSHTGVVLAVIPAIAAAAGVITFKKRK